MATRTARTAWNGGLMDGSGQVELTSSGVGTYEVDFPKRTADSSPGTTSPEELVAAAHSSCFAMSVSNEIAQAGGTPHGLEVTADVTVGPDSTGGFGLSIVIRASVEAEIDDAGFEKAIAAAKAGCPVSKALAAIPITYEIERA
jgi:lipoyl-dependent peroxiredoxin